MSDPAFEMQKAIRAALIADASLATIMGGAVRFYDVPPPDALMPYLTIDTSAAAEWDVTPTESDDGHGHEITILIHSWSAYEGMKETGQMIRRVEEIVRDLAPELTAHRLVNIRFQFSDRLRDPDGQALHGVIQFRAVTEEL